ncbi:MAG: glycosyltransferase, partial [Sphingomonadales bacterium]|nr:glycosyltransferase [Sphingomonadales bacterium]
MRIAHVTSQLCRRSAGLGAAVSAFSAATEEAGNDVRVFGLSSRGWRERDSADWTGAPVSVFEPATWSGPLGYAPGLLAALLDFEPDVVHLHGLWTYPAIAADHWSRITGRPLVVSAHGMLAPVALARSRRRKAVARKLFQDRVLHGADLLHATSAGEAASYRGAGLRNRIETIPLGMSLTARPEVDSSDTRRVLFVGRLDNIKGIDWLIEAWLRLHADFPHWSLSIVGPLEPVYARELERLQHRAAGSRVSFPGPLYGDGKDRYVAGSDLLVMPSRSENFGLAAAESLMMGVPVIATQGTPWSGLVPADAGWWIEPGPNSLEQAL